MTQTPEALAQALAQLQVGERLTTEIPSAYRPAGHETPPHTIEVVRQPDQRLRIRVRAPRNEIGDRTLEPDGFEWSNVPGREGLVRTTNEAEAPELMGAAIQTMENLAKIKEYNTERNLTERLDQSRVTVAENGNQGGTDVRLTAFARATIEKDGTIRLNRLRGRNLRTEEATRETNPARETDAARDIAKLEGLAQRIAAALGIETHDDAPLQAPQGMPRATVIDRVEQAMAEWRQDLALQNTAVAESRQRRERDSASTIATHEAAQKLDDALTLTGKLTQLEAMNDNLRKWTRRQMAGRLMLTGGPLAAAGIVAGYAGLGALGVTAMPTVAATLTGTAVMWGVCAGAAWAWDTVTSMVVAKKTNRLRAETARVMRPGTEMAALTAMTGQREDIMDTADLLLRETMNNQRHNSSDPAPGRWARFKTWTRNLAGPVGTAAIAGGATAAVLKGTLIGAVFGGPLGAVAVLGASLAATGAWNTLTVKDPMKTCARHAGISAGLAHLAGLLRNTTPADQTKLKRHLANVQTAAQSEWRKSSTEQGVTEAAQATAEKGAAERTNETGPAEKVAEAPARGARRDGEPNQW